MKLRLKIIQNKKDNTKIIKNKKDSTYLFEMLH